MAHLHEQNTKGWLHVVKDEFVCHFPYALFSVVFALISINFFNYFVKPEESDFVAHRLFHGFHFLHLIFAGTGVVLTFRKYSERIFACIAVGVSVPTIFCTLSDSILPYFSGSLLNLPMEFHWCFKDHLSTVLPFLCLGIINGLVISRHSTSRKLYYALGSHFLHILISSMASMFYLVSFGFSGIWENIGVVFIFLVIAVLVPCTLSDIVVPIMFAHSKKNLTLKDEVDCGSCSDLGSKDERH